jgi:hypothetical protein
MALFHLPPESLRHQLGERAERFYRRDGWVAKLDAEVELLFERALMS